MDIRLCVAAVLAAQLAVAAPNITGVMAQGHRPWDGKVDISYTVSGDIAATVKEQGLITSSITVSARDGNTGTSYVATSLSGDTTLTDGTHNLVWDMAVDGLTFISSNVVFSVSCETTPATYCVIDLSEGTNASSYSVSYLAEPPSGGFNVDVYKTTNLVLKRIEAGTFIMGNDQANESRRVTLTKPFYCGLFEVTQKQYLLVTGSNPSYFSRDKNPVERVSYDAIRGSLNGAKWPMSNAVDSSSFMGKLRARTDLDFDLPTEAQWEYACRAGTMTTYSYGSTPNKNYMCFDGSNTASPKEVATLKPNGWGLYDMHGNVWEWCLDWHNSTLAYGTDPKGSSSGSDRVLRGGWYKAIAETCTSSSKSCTYPSDSGSNIGFRLARPLTATSQATSYSGDSCPTTIGSPDPPMISPASSVVSWPISVTISCATEGAEIHYTTDGSEPTAESPVYRRFRITERTMVKAIAVKNGAVSEVAVAEYATGQCADPVIYPEDGTMFNFSGRRVSIEWEADEADNGVLRYTTDGSDPTADSPIYEGPFTIDDSTVVKAKAFGDQFFDSAIVTARLTRVWVNVATPVIDAPTPFTGSQTKVTLSCATKDANIRYTLDGTTPNSHSSRYTVPLIVTNNCTVKAYAIRDDYLVSDVASLDIVRERGIGDALGAPDHAFTTGGAAGFTSVEDATAPNGGAMKSGAITHNQASTLSTTVMGPGTISFKWKTSCEKDDYDLYEWDHAEFSIGGTVVAKLDGETGWTSQSFDVAGNGSHSLVWRYVKDDVASEGGDCLWVADYRWRSGYTETQTTEVPIPYEWFRANDPYVVDEYDAYEAEAMATAVNGHDKVIDCYVAGISPSEPDAAFRAVISWENGEPKITWNPDLNENGTKNERVYTILGRVNLNEGDWAPVTDANREEMHFFKVKVEMP